MTETFESLFGWSKENTFHARICDLLLFVEKHSRAAIDFSSERNKLKSAIFKAPLRSREETEEAEIIVKTTIIFCETNLNTDWLKNIFEGFTVSYKWS